MMNRKCIIGLFLSISLSLATYAQFDSSWGYVSRPEAFRLRQSLETERNDSLRMYANRLLGFFYFEIDQDSSLYYFGQQLQLAQKLGIKLWAADAYGQMGDDLRKKGAIMESYDALLKGIDIAKDPAAESSNWRVSSFSNARNFRESRLAILGILYHDLGSLYDRIADSAHAIVYYRQAIDIGKEIQNGKILSLTYSDLIQYATGDSALILARKSLEYSQLSGYRKSLGLNYRNLARFFVKTGQLDSARENLYAAIQVSTEQDSYRHTAWASFDLAKVFQSERKYDSMYHYARETLVYGTLHATPEAMVGANRLIADYFSRIGRSDSAYHYEQVTSGLIGTLREQDIRNLTQYQKFSFDKELISRQSIEEAKIRESRRKIYGLLAGLAVLLFMGIFLFRNNLAKQKANTRLQEEKDKVSATLQELKATQAQLIQSEKMASLGELTAGIAHEIQNPLNFVNNFSEVNQELVNELVEEVGKGNQDEVKSIAADIKDNSEKISHHGKRADAIVKSMLQHTRSGSREKESTDINALCDEYLRLAYHGLRARDNSFQSGFEARLDPTVGKISVMPQEIGRVILNLINNAFYAVWDKKKTAGEGYDPRVTITTRKMKDKVKIEVKDNGNGIPESVREKIFQPFFTTKPTGVGTGLGLSLSYDIIKAHGGKISLDSKQNEGHSDEQAGTVFIVQLPA